MHRNSSAATEAIDASADIARRRLLLGAAWSVPIVAVAIGTPLAAASGTPVQLTAYFGGASNSRVGSQPTDPESTLTVQGPTTYYIQAGDDGFGDAEINFTVERSDGGAEAAPRLLIGSISSPGIGPLSVIFRNASSGDSLVTRFTVPAGIEPRTLFPVEFTYFYEATAAAAFDALPIWSIGATGAFLPDITGTIAADSPLTAGVAIE